MNTGLGVGERIRNTLHIHVMITTRTLETVRDRVTKRERKREKERVCVCEKQSLLTSFR